MQSLETEPSKQKKTGKVDRKYFNTINYRVLEQRRVIALTGVLNLSSSKKEEGFSDIKGLGTHSKVKTLILSGNPIKSLTGLRPHPNLTEIIADDTDISSYEGLTGHFNLCKVSFKNTPLSEKPNFRLELCIVIGPHLSFINGTKVTIEEKRQAASYPLIARDLIVQGWDVEIPVPSKSKFKELLLDPKYDKIAENQSVRNSTTSLSPEHFKRPIIYIPPDAEKHEIENLENSENYENLEETETKNELLIKLSQKLRVLNISVDESKDVKEQEEEMIDIITNLSNTMLKLSDITNQIMNPIKEEDFGEEEFFGEEEIFDEDKAFGEEEFGVFNEEENEV